jgi:hypothetical protein
MRKTMPSSVSQETSCKRLGGIAFVVVSIIGVMLPAAAFGTPVGHEAAAMREWRTAIHALASPGAGCYTASYPSVKWRATTCQTQPRIPAAPLQVAASGRTSAHRSPTVAPATPATVGNNTDYVATVTGTMSSAIGTFPYVSSGATETGQVNGMGPQLANTYTLQLNSQMQPDIPECSGASDPAKCLGWEQFVYGTDNNHLYIQYWLMNYNNTCLSGWNTYQSPSSSAIDCWTNSAASTVGSTPPVSQLGAVTFEGKAAAGGDDEAVMTVSGTATMLSTPDSMLGLASWWNTAEFGIFGDYDLSEATFSAGTTLDERTTVDNGTNDAPTCASVGTTGTGETNNLNLVAAPSFTTGPAIEDEQSTTSGIPSCSTAAGPPSAAGRPAFGPALDTSGLSATGSFYGISCSDNTDCTAVGSDSNNVPIYATETAGVWGSATELPAPLGGGGVFRGVSCTSPRNCVAVGADTYESGHPIAVTESAGTWGVPVEVSTPSIGGQLNGVSCPVAGDCTAVGVDSNGRPIYATESAGSWSAAEEVSTHSGSGEFNGVSCTSPPACTAAGNSGGQPIYATESSGAWGAAIQMSNPTSAAYLTAISCASAAACAVVGYDSNNMPVHALQYGGTWSSLIQDYALGGGSFSGVSCPLLYECTAVGSDVQGKPIYETPLPGVGSEPVEVPAPAGSGAFTSVDCVNDTVCTAAGEDGQPTPMIAYAPPTVPSTPKLLSVTRGNTTVTVAYSAPSSDGGAAIEEYAVLQSTGLGFKLSTTIPATCTGSPCIVIGLKNGTAYRFKIDAVNAVGQSPVSATSAAVTPATTPNAPVLSAVTSGHRSIKATWRAPGWDGGAPVTHYTAIATNGSHRLTCGTSATSCTIWRLTNGVKYTVSVIATNEVGNSKSSNTKTATPH